MEKFYKKVTALALPVFFGFLALPANAFISNAGTPTIISVQSANQVYNNPSQFGDVNGDGYKDLLVSSFISPAPGTATDDSVLVYMGSSAGIPATPTKTLFPVDGAYHSFSIHTALGDIDHDGYDDAVIASYGLDGSDQTHGKIYVYMGSISGLPDLPTLVIPDPEAGDNYFGTAVAMDDINNDNYLDVLYSASSANSYAGRVYVHMGSASGITATPDLVLNPSDPLDYYFGSDISMGDFNGDGFADAIIGEIDNEGGGFIFEGRAYVYMGSALGLAAVPALTLDPANQANAYFGDGGTISIGDINGDTYDDAIFGARGVNAEAAGEGRAYVYMGSALGLAAVPALTLDPTDQAGASFGAKVSMKDINRDGYSDAVIAATFYDAEASNEGRVYIYKGSSSGLNSSPTLTLDPIDQANAFWGSSITTGDGNNDGYPDVWVMGPKNAGMYEYFGSPDEQLVYQDTNNDGQVDNLRWTFNENVTACPYVAGNWSVATAGTIAVTAITGLTCTGSDHFLDIAVTAGAGKTGGTTNPAITYNYSSGSHITLASGNLGTHVARAATDAAAPVILSMSPAAGATNVLLTSPVVATFSEPMNGPGTACTFTSAPNPGGYALITDAANWSNGDKTVTLSHTSSYARGTAVSVTIGGCTDASAAHNALATNPAVANPSTFTTISGISGGGGSGGGGSVANPSITIRTPAAGASYDADDVVGLDWTPANGAFTKYKVSYSRDSGATWTVISDNATSANASWIVPDAGTTAGLIKVEGYDANNTLLATGTSGVFTVIGEAVPDEDNGTPTIDPTVLGAYTSKEALENNPDFNTDMNLPPAPPFTAWCVSGSLIKTESSSSVYYCGADGKRYVFVNDKAYFSWYPDFSNVQTINEQTMAEIVIGGNITYRPGSRMIKIQSDPKVYVVAHGGILRWVATEAVAVRLFGMGWNTMIDDVPDSFFVNYILGQPIME